MAQTTYGIIGCGAVGGYYGGRLQQSGLDVHFLAHGDYQHIRRHGLVIQSKDGDFGLPRVHVYDDPNTMPPCDVVVVALKTTRNHLLPQLIPPVVKPDGIVLMLQNGLGNEEQAASVVGNNRVLGGLSFICSNKVGPGHIRHLDYGLVQLGVHPAAAAGSAAHRWLDVVATDFQRADIPVATIPNLQSARWQKLVWNIPFNGLSVVLEATTHQIMADPDARRLAQQLMEEVAKAAAACHSAVPEGTTERMLERTARMVPYHTSMKVDFDARRPLEIEAIFGNPLRAADAAGLSMPQVRMLDELLRFLDHRNRGQATKDLDSP